MRRSSRATCLAEGQCGAHRRGRGAGRRTHSAKSWSRLATLSSDEQSRDHNRHRSHACSTGLPTAMRRARPADLRPAGCSSCGCCGRIGAARSAWAMPGRARQRASREKGQQRERVDVLGYLFFIGDKKDHLPYRDGTKSGTTGCDFATRRPLRFRRHRAPCRGGAGTLWLSRFQAQGRSLLREDLKWRQ